MAPTAVLREARRAAEAQKQQVIADHELETASSAELIEMLGVAGSPRTIAAIEILSRRGTEPLDALIAGLHHPNARIRAECALLMDHLGDDRCTAPLIDVLHHDPMEAVRRSALHSLSCQNCKVCPLSGDILTPILHTALRDRSLAVRRRAVQYLVGQARDARVIPALQTLREREQDEVLLRRVERALEWHGSAA